MSALGSKQASGHRRDKRSLSMVRAVPLSDQYLRAPADANFLMDVRFLDARSQKAVWQLPTRCRHWWHTPKLHGERARFRHSDPTHWHRLGRLRLLWLAQRRDQGEGHTAAHRRATWLVVYHSVFSYYERELPVCRPVGPHSLASASHPLQTFTQSEKAIILLVDGIGEREDPPS